MRSSQPEIYVRKVALEGSDGSSRALENHLIEEIAAWVPRYNEKVLGRAREEIRSLLMSSWNVCAGMNRA